MNEFPTQFWMVVGIGKGAPTRMHDCRDIAADEARRLARANPGVAFVVLEAVEAVTKREFDTITFRAAPANNTVATASVATAFRTSPYL